MNSKLKTWLDIHSYVSLFFLPLAILYAVTGGLMVFESQGEDAKRRPGPVPGVRMMAGPEAERNAAGDPQKALGAKAPSDEQGRPDYRSFAGSERSEGIEGAGPRQDSGLLLKLKLMHKAKGGAAVGIMGISFAAALALMYVSGIWMCWASKTRRRGMLIAGAIGLVATIAVITLQPALVPPPPR